MFEYYNANQFGNDVLDCSVRTLSVVEGISWEEAYDNLSDSARNSGLMMDSVEAVEEYLDRYYERTPIYEETVGEFIDNHPYGIYAITMPNHITALKDGINYDTWDSSDRKIWSAWKIL